MADADITRLYGYIACWGDVGETPWQQVNAEYLARLPEDDRYPVLTREMFACANGYASTQLISFGRFYCDLESVWQTWKGKFELLLRELTWNEAHVFVETEHKRRFHCFWQRLDEYEGSFGFAPTENDAWHYEGPQDL